MFRLIEVSIIIVMRLFNFGQCDNFFASQDDLQSLLGVHDAVIEEMGKYVTEEERKLDILKTYHRIFVNANSKENNLFIFIKRLTVDLDFIMNITKLQKAFERNLNLPFPTEVDLAGAGDALVRIQQTYALDVPVLAEGTLIRSETQHIMHTPLTANDCYVIGRTMYDTGAYKIATEWLRHAVSLYTLEDQDMLLFNKIDIIRYCVEAYKHLDDIPNTTKWLIRLRKMQASSTNVNDVNRNYKMRLLSGKYDWNKELGPPDDSAAYWMDKSLLQKYYALCRGETDPEDNNRLQCWYKRGSHPFLKLAPFKTEQLHATPEVYLFHDIVTDHEIDDLIKFNATPRERARVRDPNGVRPSRFRIGKFVSMWDIYTEVVARLSRRTDLMTGLSLETAEPLQVLNYGMGGSYDPHNDYSKVASMIDEDGNRIATVVYYLSDVPEGGSTVFLHMGLSIKPKKGSALFWMNLNPSGLPEVSTLHASCPVLFGSKWVGVRWLRAAGQEFRRPCKPEEESHQPTQKRRRF